MKRVTYALLTALALVAVLSTAALADCGSCGTEKAHASKTAIKGAAAKAAPVKMGDCCIASAKAGKGCCGMDAKGVKAKFAAFQAGAKAGCSDAELANCSTAEKAACAAGAEANCAVTKVASKAALADMHECCAGAVEASKGCCGKDADTLKASYMKKVAYHKVAASVKADMHECCAGALAAGKGCCGMDATGLKADYESKVKKAAKVAKL